MTEDQIRHMVREVVARRLADETASEREPDRPAWRAHPSHIRLALPVGRDGDGPCLVEPAVGCTHCGFCQSWGH